MRVVAPVKSQCKTRKMIKTKLSGTDILQTIPAKFRVFKAGITFAHSMITFAVLHTRLSQNLLHFHLGKPSIISYCRSIHVRRMKLFQRKKYVQGKS